jgi:GT2 family glycosyltransferase
MPHPPKVSVWIPSYNHAQYLPAAIESVLGQTYKDFELIIVDDGSSDDSLAIAQGYAAKYPDIIQVHTHPGHQNRGISETVNLAYSKTRGQYLSGVASDDLLLPEKLERQVAFLEENQDVGWIYGPIKILNQSNVQGFERLWGKDITHDADPVESLIKSNAIHGVTVLMRRRCVEGIGLHDPSLVFSDWDFWIRLISHAKAAFLPEPLAVWRVHEYNTSAGIDELVGFGRLADVLQALRRKSPAIGGALARRHTQALLDLQAAFYLFLLGEEQTAARALKAAFETDHTLRKSTDYFVNWLRELPPIASERDAVRLRRSRFAEWVLQNLPENVNRGLARRVSAFCFRESALANHYRDLPLARRMVLECVKRDPRLLLDPPVRQVLVRSLAGEHLIGSLRRIKRAIPW